MDPFDQDLLSRSSLSLDQHRDVADLGGLVALRSSGPILRSG